MERIVKVVTEWPIMAVNYPQDRDLDSLMFRRCCNGRI